MVAEKRTLFFSFLFFSCSCTNSESCSSKVFSSRVWGTWLKGVCLIPTESELCHIDLQSRHLLRQCYACLCEGSECVELGSLRVRLLSHPAGTNQWVDPAPPPCVERTDVWYSIESAHTEAHFRFCPRISCICTGLVTPRGSARRTHLFPWDRTGPCQELASYWTMSRADMVALLIAKHNARSRCLQPMHQ